MYLRKHDISVVAGTSKGDVEYTSVFNGFVHCIDYIKSTGTALSSTATLAIVTEQTSQNVLASLAVGAASFRKCPRISTVVNSTNSTLTPCTGGGDFAEYIPVVGERLKLTVAACSAAAQVGTFRVYTMGG